jgi:uncharacterized protein YjbI with pentapeptide repeats
MESLFSIAEKIGTPLSLAALTVLVLYVLFKTLLERLPTEKLLGPHVLKLLSMILTLVFWLALVALVLGVIAYILSLYISSMKTARIEEHVRVMSFGSIPERISAIADLDEIGRELPEAAPRICEALSSLGRNLGHDNVDITQGRLADDLQRAITALSNLIANGRCSEVSLAGIDLRRLQLPNGVLTKVDLTNSNLEEANLRGGNLTSARLTGAILASAVLRGANLSEALLGQVRWYETDLRTANLTKAKGIAGADLLTVRAEGAVFDGVDLRRTKFPFTGLAGVSLKGADLRETNLRTVRGLCKETVAKAIKDDTTLEPSSYGC